MNEALSISTLDIRVPNGWEVLDPPEGVAFIAVEPEPWEVVRANVVVNPGPRPVTQDQNAIDGYLDDVLAALEATLVQPSFEAVWVAAGGDQPQQRLVVRHRVEDVEVEMVQQHTWLDDAVVVITATVAPDADDDLIELLDVCLSSAATDPFAEFIDWQRPD